MYLNNFFGEVGKYARENALPLSATFELTPFCNFACVMCYVRLTTEQADRQGKLLSAEQWLDIARQTRDMGTLNLTLTGGEPFSRPDFWEIYGELNQLGFLITILSNGALIDEKAIEKFEKAGMPYAMKLTLYGASDETYQRVCGDDKGFTRISHAIDLLKEVKIPFTMTGTIVKENANDMQEMYRFAWEKKIPFQHTISVVKSARGATNTVELSRFAFDDFPDELTIETIEQNRHPGSSSPFARCSSYRSSYWMTWNGHLQLCSFMNGPYVPYNGDLQEVWKELGDRLGRLRNPPECVDCPWVDFCQRCPGILCAESGDPEKIDKTLCQTAEYLYKLYQKKLHMEES